MAIGFGTGFRFGMEPRPSFWFRFRPILKVPISVSDLVSIPFHFKVPDPVPIRLHFKVPDSVHASLKDSNLMLRLVEI